MKTALAFDVYGTLIDTAGVVTALRGLVGDRAETFSRLWREKQLEYSFRRALMRRYEKFSVCVSESLDYVSQALDVSLTPDEKAGLLEAYASLPPFDDAEPCLAGLATDEFALYALSNGSRDAVDGLLSGAGLRDRFIDIVSVDEVETFKPDPAVYHHFLARAGVPGNAAWLVSANPFDVIGAVSAGMCAVSVERSAIVFDHLGFEPTAVVSTLGDLPRAIEEAIARR